MHQYKATMRVVICPTMKYFQNPVLSSYRLRLIKKLLALKEIVINFESQDAANELIGLTQKYFERSGINPRS